MDEKTKKSKRDREAKMTGGPRDKKKEVPKRKSACPYAGRCGGCTGIDLPMEEQLKKKQAWVEKCIGSFGLVDPILRMKNPMRYRNKVTSVFGLDRKGHPVCGVYRAHSREIVPVKDCLIENKRADLIIQDIFALLPSFKLRVYDEVTGQGIIRAVQVRTAQATGEFLVTIVTAGPIFPSRNHFTEALLRKHPEITSIVQNINDKDTSMILGERERVLYGPGYITDELCGCRFRISSRSFYQINYLQTQKLYRIAVDMGRLSGKERVLDAYCGIGTIGIIAAKKAKEVLSVELNGAAVQDARINVQQNNLTNVQVEEADAGDFMQDMAMEGRKVDVLFMDPPRSGASEAFLSSVLQLLPKRIVYISCNPETLSRDLRRLSPQYEMERAIPVDMFPFVDGVETVVSLFQP